MLKDPESLELFEKFAKELVAIAVSVKDPILATARIESRYAAWRKFWQADRKGLTQAEAMGLFGELSFLSRLLREGHDPDEVLSAWRGPEKAPKDFMLPDEWIEVKTIGSDRATVRISSIEQLSPAPAGQTVARKGRLVVYQIDSVKEKRGENLDSLVLKIKAFLKDFQHAILLFEDNLDLVGYKEGEGKAASAWFRIVGMLEYRASASDFPSLRREAVPIEIADASYELQLAGLRNWLIEANKKD